MCRGLVGLLAVSLGVGAWGGAALAKPAGEETKTPQAIYRDMQRALRGATSLVIHGQGSLQDGSTFVATSSWTATAMHEVNTSDRVPIESLGVHGASFTRGGDFGTEWLLASRDPRCVQAGVSRSFDFAHVGTLTKGSVSTIGRTRVLEIDDDGKAPDATPMQVFVSLDGPPLPVRTVQTGPATAGPDTCPLNVLSMNPEVGGTENWTFGVSVAAIKSPKPFIDASVSLLAQATLQPLADTLTFTLTGLNNQFGQITDPTAATANFQQTAQAYQTFATAMGKITFPSAVQGEAQSIITMANTVATATANAAGAAGQGDPNAVTSYNQQQSSFQSALSTFETHLQTTY